MTLSFFLLPSSFFLLPSSFFLRPYFFFCLHPSSVFLLPQMTTDAPVSIDSCDAWRSWGGLSRDDFTTTQSSAQSAQNAQKQSGSMKGGLKAKAATAFEMRAMVRGEGRGAVKIAGITGSSTVLLSNPNLSFGVQAGLCREAAAFLVFNLEVRRTPIILYPCTHPLYMYTHHISIGTPPKHPKYAPYIRPIHAA